MLLASDDWERLHPLSPLLRAARIVVFLLAAMANSAQSATELPRPLLIGALGIVVAVAAAYSYVAWQATGFRLLTTGELELRTGVLFRSQRRVPLGRIETIDIRRPVLARLLGLAEVRVEVVSQGDSEVKLQYLTDRDAEAVKHRLTELARGEPEPGPAAGAEEPLLSQPVGAVNWFLQVPAREIVIGYAVAPVVGLAVMVGIVFVSSVFGDGSTVAGAAVFAVFTGLSTVLPLAARVDRLLQFRLGASPGALHVERGLLNQLAQRVNLGRVQAIRIEEPLFWRWFGRARLTVDVAGYRGGSRQQDSETAVLLPIGTLAVVQYLLDLLPGAITTEGLDFRPAPRAARWRSPLRWHHYLVAFTDSHAVIRSGVWRKRTDIVAHGKAQSVRVTDGPWQRACGIATLHFDTAGGRIKAQAKHREVDDALELAMTSRRLDQAT